MQPMALLLLLFLSALLSPAVALNVRDTDGDALQPNTGEYYMIAVTPPSAGGVTLVGHDAHGGCPRRLGLSSSEENKGIPVVVVPDDTTAKKVEVGKPVKFRFAFIYHCVPDAAWGVEWNPNGPNYMAPNIEPELFRLSYDKSSRSYFLGHCDGGICRSVGVREENSEMFLVLGGPSQQLRFVFDKYQPRLQI